MFLNVSLNQLAILYTVRRYDSRQSYYFYRQYSFAYYGEGVILRRLSYKVKSVYTAFGKVIPLIDIYPDTIIRNVKAISIELDSCRDKGFVLFHN
jgi:hypothetical protein